MGKSKIKIYFNYCLDHIQQTWVTKYTRMNFGLLDVLELPRGLVNFTSFKILIYYIWIKLLSIGKRFHTN